MDLARRASIRAAEDTLGMVTVPELLMERLLEPQPTPPGMTSREIVRRTIEFDDPPRIPYSFMVPLKTDFFETGFLEWLERGQNESASKPKLGDTRYDEWGIGWEVTTRWWDHSIHHPLENLGELPRYRFPDVADPERFTWMAPHLKRACEAGKYVVGSNPIGMYERMRHLLGFEELMVAPYTQPEGLEALLDHLTDLTIAVMDQWVRVGPVDAFMSAEDFGLQTTLQMKIDTFRKFYKPHYARLVEACHRKGMRYIWHNCGQILDMIPDMIEIGVDAVQLDQPRLMGYKRLTDEFGGKICFWNTLDIQWSTQASVTAEEVRAEVAKMTKTFARFHGGFIARHYPQPWDIHLSNEMQMAIYEAFLENGCAL
jgi:hypothetical protein